jgi:hypothetical protein
MEARAGIEPTYADLQFYAPSFPKPVSAKDFVPGAAENSQLAMTFIDIR